MTRTSVARCAFYISIALVYCSVFAVGPGFKRRIAEADAEDALAANAAASSSSNDPAPDSRGGGIRQRLAAATESAKDEKHTGKQGPFWKSLKQNWAKGDISSKVVQELAQGATVQGCTGAEKIAAVGTSGNNPQNMFRDLRTTFGWPLDAPELSWFRIPTKRGVEAHPFLLPHLTFMKHYERGVHWQSSMVGPEGSCLEFWENMQHTHYVKKHPSMRPNDWATTVPIGIHGDAGAFTKHDSVYAFSWNSLLGEAGTFRKRFLFTVMRKADMTSGTLDAIFKLMVWSFDCMLTGELPALNYHGQRNDGGGTLLANGFRAALFQIRGDWAFLKEAMQFPAWNNAEKRCWLCKASNTIRRLTWTDCTSTAGWRDTMYTHESFLLDRIASGLGLPVLLSGVGVRVECVTIDILHVMDQGVTSHIVGNILWILAIGRGLLGGRTHADRIKKLAAHLKQWYKETRCKSQIQGKLTIERLRTSAAWPKLKAKAAATRHLAEYILALMVQYSDESLHDQRALALCRVLVDFYKLMETESMFLRPEARSAIAVLGLRISVLYSGLASAAADSLERFWKMSPKIHMLIHVCLNASSREIGHINPRYFWTYQDEDLVGLLCEVAQSVHVCTLAVSTIFKWVCIAFD